jgi:hypothetical protein
MGPLEASVPYVLEPTPPPEYNKNGGHVSVASLKRQCNILRPFPVSKQQKGVQ